MFVYVYGTLKSGYGNWSRLLDGRSTLVTSGTLQGFKLFDVHHRKDTANASRDAWELRNAFRL